MRHMDYAVSMKDLSSKPLYLVHTSADGILYVVVDLLGQFCNRRRGLPAG